MGQLTMANSERTESKEKESTNGQMAECIAETGKRTKWRGRECCSGAMEESTGVSL